MDENKTPHHHDQYQTELENVDLMIDYIEKALEDKQKQVAKLRKSTNLRQRALEDKKLILNRKKRELEKMSLEIKNKTQAFQTQVDCEQDIIAEINQYENDLREASLKSKILDKKRISKLEAIKSVQEKNHKTKSILDKSVAKLEAVKHHTLQLEEQNSRLEVRNHELHRRNAEVEKLMQAKQGQIKELDHKILSEQKKKTDLDNQYVFLKKQAMQYGFKIESMKEEISKVTSYHKAFSKNVNELKNENLHMQNYLVENQQVYQDLLHKNDQLRLQELDLKEDQERLAPAYKAFKIKFQNSQSEYLASIDSVKKLDDELAEIKYKLSHIQSETHEIQKDLHQLKNQEAHLESGIRAYKREYQVSASHLEGLQKEFSDSKKKQEGLEEMAKSWRKRALSSEQ